MGLSLKTNAWWSLSLTQDQKVVIGRGLAKVTSLMGDLKYFVPFKQSHSINKVLKLVSSRFKT